jgi:hypothetical protein
LLMGSFWKANCHYCQSACVAVLHERFAAWLP